MSLKDLTKVTAPRLMQLKELLNVTNSFGHLSRQIYFVSSRCSSVVSNVKQSLAMWREEHEHIRLAVRFVNSISESCIMFTLAFVSVNMRQMHSAFELRAFLSINTMAHGLVA